MAGYVYECRVHDNAVKVKRTTGPETLKVAFRRTVRVPDNSSFFHLPPDLGKFPLYEVNDYKESLPKEMSAKGGISMPMHQREAMWIRFSANAPFAIKIYAGLVNVISGKRATAKATSNTEDQNTMAHGKNHQDYVVTPNQPWLDGIATEAGVVKQFMATRLGDGYTVEAQVTGEEMHGGTQFEVTPAVVKECPKHTVFVKTLTGNTIVTKVACHTTVEELQAQIEVLEGLPVELQRLIYAGRQMEREVTLNLILRLCGGGDGRLGLAAGGKIKQFIMADHWPADKWHKTATIAFNVHILDAAVFKAVTGLQAPASPITPKLYEGYGLPFFDWYNEPSTTIHGDFINVKSIGETDGVEERDYKISTKTIDPAVKDPKDISNPAGPFNEFRSVNEIEQKMDNVRLAGSD